MVQGVVLLSFKELEGCIKASVPNFATRWLNTDQEDAVSAAAVPPVFIVAGPGTGKTTVLALRVLKHVYVDGFPPDSIIATTFTRKAAKELRSRILGWGANVHQEALQQSKRVGNSARTDWLMATDLNLVRTGTLDSLAEEMIEDDRQPGGITPTVIEPFMATGLLRRNVMYSWHGDAVLAGHLETLEPGTRGSFSDKLRISHGFAERVLHDAIDLVKYGGAGPGHEKLRQVVEQYHNYLSNAELMDFGLLEQSLLSRLQNGGLKNTVDKLKALLVDEFQDSNYLQEQIYYSLCARSQAALTVVGDDDQSVYRFRGATVEIFSDFENRIKAALGSAWTPRRIDLTENYRSTSRIANLCNHFISSEPDFQPARAPGKKAIIARGQYAAVNFPVLGMFRSDVKTLADNLCTFLGDIFRGSGHVIPIAGGQQLTITQANGGDFGDAVLLAHSVKELKEGWNGAPPTQCLPYLIRDRLQTQYGVNVFNPRGKSLSDIDDVGCLLGLMLNCIDPGGAEQNAITTMRPSTKTKLDAWRARAQTFATGNPSPNGLLKFVSDWGRRTPTSMRAWPREWPLLELMFTLETWFPVLQRTPEGQVYLEAIARAMAEAAQISSYESMVLYGTTHDTQSVKEAIREVFESIAEGEVEVDEEIMPYVPRSNFPIMTIHQAKGLEFPLVIVDVGSAFRTNHPMQRRTRYPESGDSVHLMEDLTANYSPVGPTRTSRTMLQRAFDDLRRLYYVAKSRPHAVLLLVGLTTQIPNPGAAVRVRSVATGDLYVPPNSTAPTRRMYDFTPASSWTLTAADNVIALI